MVMLVGALPWEDQAEMSVWRAYAPASPLAFILQILKGKSLLAACCHLSHWYQWKTCLHPQQPPTSQGSFPPSLWFSTSQHAGEEEQEEQGEEFLVAEPLQLVTLQGFAWWILLCTGLWDKTYKMSLVPWWFFGNGRLAGWFAGWYFLQHTGSHSWILAVREVRWCILLCVLNTTIKAFVSNRVNYLNLQLSETRRMHGWKFALNYSFLVWSFL